MKNPVKPKAGPTNPKGKEANPSENQNQPAAVQTQHYTPQDAQGEFMAVDNALVLTDPSGSQFILRGLPQGVGVLPYFQHVSNQIQTELTKIMVKAEMELANMKAEAETEAQEEVKEEQKGPVKK